MLYAAGAACFFTIAADAKMRSAVFFYKKHVRHPAISVSMAIEEQNQL